MLASFPALHRCISTYAQTCLCVSFYFYLLLYFIILVCENRFPFQHFRGNDSLLWPKAESTPWTWRLQSRLKALQEHKKNKTAAKKTCVAFTCEFYCEIFNVLYTGVHRPYTTCPACINIVVIIYRCSYTRTWTETKFTKLQMISRVKKREETHF